MLTISTSKRRFTVKTEQEEALFSKIVKNLLDKDGTLDIDVQNSEVSTNSKTEKKVITREEALADRNPPVEHDFFQNLWGGKKYTGFLYIKCPECGAEKGFCSKKGTGGIHCDVCGCNKDFEEPLKPMYVNCECGGRFKYMTNKSEEMFDVTCINCGSPVPVQYNHKKEIYETIR